MPYKYPIAKPDLNGNEKKYVAEAMETGWISSLGPKVVEAEEAWAKYIGTKYALTCSSGTTALTLALAALKIGPGDEVIVPDFTMIASAWAVSHVGAQPVFVDCGSDMNIDVSLIEKAITPHTKAIMPVHIYGRPCDMAAIMKIAHDYNLYVIEDACEAHGATVGDKKVGGIGDIGCFSLYSNKIITSGEGGIITTNDKRLYEQMKHLRGMAFDPQHTFLHKKVGYNFRMTNLQAAVALGQIERIDEFLEKRKQICSWYDEQLGYSLPRPDGSVLWMYDMIFDSYSRRNKVMKACLEAGIETRFVFKPMSWQPMYKENIVIDPDLRAGRASDRGCYLPVYTDLTKEDVDYICSIVKSAL